MAFPKYWEMHDGSPPENYERYLVPAMFDLWASSLLDLAAPQPGERVLDVACGTGAVARVAAQRVGPAGRVVGLDINPGMLAVARSVPSTGASIEWREASAEAMPFSEETFDLVLCQMGLQFFPDRLGALREMHRVLTPSGRIALNVAGPMEQSPFFHIMNDALRRHIGSEAAGFLGMVFSLDNADDLRALIMCAGFRDVTVRPLTSRLTLPPSEEFLWQYVASTPLAASVGRADDQARQALVDEVANGSHRYAGAEGVASPILVYEVIAAR